MSSPCLTAVCMMSTCTFVPGLVERNVELHFSGVVKPIYEENPDPSGDHVYFSVVDMRVQL